MNLNLLGAKFQMKLFILKNSKKIRYIVIAIIWLGIWQAIYKGVGKEILIPSPFNTAKTLIHMLGEKNLYLDIGVTFYRVIWGIGISFFIGMLTAIGAHYSIIIRDFLKPLVIILKTTPVMAVIILALLWFTSSDVPIFVCFLMCYPIAYTNILTGLDHVDSQILEVAHVYRVKKIYILKDVYMPHIKPYIAATLSLITGLAWKVIIAAEVLAVPTYSMGYNLLNAKVYLETERLFAWVIIIIGLSSLCEKIIEKYILRKRIKEKHI